MLFGIMIERLGTREILASFALAAGSIGGVVAVETVKVSPISVSEPPQLPPVYRRSNETPLSDSNGELYDPTLNQLVAEGPLVRTHSARRKYGRNGQIGNRTRGDVRF